MFEIKCDNLFFVFNISYAYLCVYFFHKIFDCLLVCRPNYLCASNHFPKLDII